jgi:radical SAM protein with 4Fe4S-binding SPASM domain
MPTYSRTGTLFGTGHSDCADAAALPVPRLVQWLTTFRCDLRCPHCLTGASASDRTEMSLAQARHLVDQVADLGVEEFLLSGGEPMLRPDLPEVIALLHRREVAYSVNTAVLPPPAVQAAMKEYPPAFAAVSVDGPAEVHDAFRGRAGAFDEALAAIRFFRHLGAEVAAGTTVTSISFPCLPQTFLTVAASGATCWGIHLLIGEGRAAGRDDLFLSRPQLRRLLEFVAAKRQYFPVQMADEMGYCGDWEPLVRDRPLVCGAGRAQCVILPDGEVVPCTTLDRSCSAGNVLLQPLGKIWRDGFAELRRWRPAGRCARCAYRRACGGGCWLQRRTGQGCYRDIWHVAAALKTRASAAVCLGTLLAGGAACAGDGPALASAPQTRPGAMQVPPELGSDTPIGGGIEEQILLWEAGGPVYPLPSAPVPSADLHEDPAWQFFRSYRDGDLPADLEHYTAAVKAALKTQQRSLSFAALLWRSMMERLLADSGPQARSQQDRQRIAATLAEMETAANQWRAEIFQKKLDPYLRRGLLPEYSFMASKAGPPQWVLLELKVERERWGEPAPHGPAPHGSAPDGHEEAVEAYLARHPYAWQKTISFSLPEGQELVLVNAQGERRVNKSGDWGIYDIAVTPATDQKITLEVRQIHASLPLVLPANCQITYADLLRLSDQQCKDTLEKLFAQGRRQDVPEMLSLVLRRYRQLQSEPPSTNPVSFYERRGELQATAAWLADFWLF